MKTTVLAVSLSLFVAACGGSPATHSQPAAPMQKAPAAKKPAAAPAMTQSVGHLVLADMELKAGANTLTIAATGEVRMDGQSIATLHGDGRLVLGADGAQYRLMPDGRITGDESLMRQSIGQDGVVLHGGRAAMSIDDAGRVHPIEGWRDDMVIKGPPAGRRAATFAYVILSRRAKP